MSAFESSSAHIAEIISVERISGELEQIEAQHSVDVLYACESGSRGWGFASEDSDYDVRFIYRHPREWYLSIEDKRDVIELPISDQLDIAGWDLRDESPK